MSGQPTSSSPSLLSFCSKSGNNGTGNRAEEIEDISEGELEPFLRRALPLNRGSSNSFRSHTSRSLVEDIQDAEGAESGWKTIPASPDIVTHKRKRSPSPSAVLYLVDSEDEQLAHKDKKQRLEIDDSSTPRAFENDEQWIAKKDYKPNSDSVQTFNTRLGSVKISKPLADLRRPLPTHLMHSQSRLSSSHPPISSSAPSRSSLSQPTIKSVFERFRYQGAFVPSTAPTLSLHKKHTNASKAKSKISSSTHSKHPSRSSNKQRGRRHVDSDDEPSETEESDYEHSEDEAKSSGAEEENDNAESAHNDEDEMKGFIHDSSSDRSDKENTVNSDEDDAKVDPRNILPSSPSSRPYATRRSSRLGRQAAYTAPASHRPAASATTVTLNLVDADDDMIGQADHSSTHTTTTGSVRHEKITATAKHDAEKPVATLDELIERCEEYSQKMRAALHSGCDTVGLVGEQPGGITRPLKDYQREGVSWLLRVNALNLNGILADEMGLGKTIQTIALLSILRERQATLSTPPAPHLIVVPASTLHNWQREFAQWAPSLSVVIYSGSQKERESIQYELLSAKKRRGRMASSYTLTGNDVKASSNGSADDGFDVLLTTYSFVFQKFDKKFLRKFLFDYLVLDEAQYIKNKKSQRYQTLARLRSRRRLLLTGTPLQNNLEELWTLLSFLMPTMFGTTAADAQEWDEALSTVATTAEAALSYVPQLKKILAPFVLRRRKAEVKLQLLPKKEVIEWCEMTPFQEEVYAGLVRKSRHLWKAYKAAKKVGGDDVVSTLPTSPATPQSPASVDKTHTAANVLNNILMQLRKVANHPLLGQTCYSDAAVRKIAAAVNGRKEFAREFRGMDRDDIFDYLRGCSDFQLHRNYCCEIPSLAALRLSDEQLYESSGKFRCLSKLLPSLKSEGHRVLIFSQMTRMLDILEVFLEHMGHEYLRLDGQTPVNERQSLIDEFNTNKEIFIFLLSTLAGGLGINLTAADVVIFYDHSFNPQVDRQAEDRCHRLGQEKHVSVIKLVTVATVEEHILRLANHKRRLTEALLDSGSVVPPSPKKHFLKKEMGGDAEAEERGKFKKATAAATTAIEIEMEDVDDNMLQSILQNVFDKKPIAAEGQGTNESTTDPRDDFVYGAQRAAELEPVCKKDETKRANTMEVSSSEGSKEGSQVAAVVTLTVDEFDTDDAPATSRPNGTRAVAPTHTACIDDAEEEEFIIKRHRRSPRSTG